MRAKKVLAVFMLCMVFSNIFGGLKVAHATGTGGAAPLGQIALFPFNFTPLGWMECDGRSLVKNNYSGLSFIVNNAFGGDATHFNLPDLRNASPIPGAKYYMSVQGSFGWIEDASDMMAVGEVALLPDRVVNAENSNLDFTNLWMKCDGRVLNETTYQNLFDTIGYNYGGDANGFKIPNLSDASPLAGLSYYIAIDGQVVRSTGNVNGIPMGDMLNNTAIMGSIELYASNWIPMGTLLCNGSTVQMNTNTALFSLLGTNYGGNVTNFGLPDLRGAAPLPGLHYTIRTMGVYPTRD